MIALAIPRDRLESTPVGDGRRDQPVQIRVTAYERSSGRFVALDSLVHFLSRDTDFSGSFANQLLELPLTPGSWRVAVKLTQGIVRPVRTRSAGAHDRSLESNNDE
ncbi:MAG: hypothetical protein IPO52_15970 [Gemmatimonadetes bacterium]|nr:hypothetical protein [Gemmatimonadota bacterium]